MRGAVAVDQGQLDVGREGVFQHLLRIVAFEDPWVDVPVGVLANDRIVHLAVKAGLNGGVADQRDAVAFLNRPEHVLPAGILGDVGDHAVGERLAKVAVDVVPFPDLGVFVDPGDSGQQLVAEHLNGGDVR